MTMVNARKNIDNKKIWVINIADLEKHSIELTGEVPLTWLKERMSFCEYSVVPNKATVQLTIESASSGILIQGEVAANVKMQCGTCLKDISMDLQSIVCTYLLPLEEYKKEIEKEELTPEDLDREYYEGETVTLDDLVGDALMLELPMNPKCGLDCPGLSVFSETPKVSSLTLDPRLAPLLEIRLNKEN